MTSTHQEPLTPEERELADRLARLGAPAEPSSALDARILAAAHDALAGRAPRRARRPRWPVALGVAATLALAVGVAWQLRPAQETAQVYSEAPAVAPAARVKRGSGPSAAEELPAASVMQGAPSPAVEAPPPPSPELRTRQQTSRADDVAEATRAAPAADLAEHEASDAAEQRDRAPARRESDAASKPQPRAQTPEAPASAFPMQDSREQAAQAPAARKQSAPEQTSATQPSRQQAAEPTAVRPAPPQPAAPAEVVFDVAAPPPPPPAPPAPAPAIESTEPAAPARARQGEAARAASAPQPEAVVLDRIETTSTRIERDNAGFTDQALDEQPPATADSPQVQRAWLQRIRELLANGDTEGARASLAEFKRRYPRYALPEDLREFAP